MSATQRVLFVSAHNSVRSQMAEALLNQFASDRYVARSAGTDPSPVDERTVQTLQSMNIPAEGLHSKPLDAFDGEAFDQIIVLWDKSSGECPPLESVKEKMVWNFKDPRTDDRHLAFTRTLQELQTRLQMLVLINERERQ